MHEHKEQWLILPHYKHTGIEFSAFPSPPSLKQCTNTMCTAWRDGSSKPFPLKQYFIWILTKIYLQYGKFYYLYFQHLSDNFRISRKIRYSIKHSAMSTISTVMRKIHTQKTMVIIWRCLPNMTSLAQNIFLFI